MMGLGITSHDEIFASSLMSSEVAATARQAEHLHIDLA